jgi:hypothetical protein
MFTELVNFRISWTEQDLADVMGIVSSVSVSVRAYEPEDAEPTWESYFRAIRDTASKDYSSEQVVAWAPESVDLVGVE